jgi:hypothetical protein
MSTKNPFEIDPLIGLISSHALVSGIDPNDPLQSFSYSGLDGSTPEMSSVGAWYQAAVYWKYKALNALRGEVGRR